MQEELTETSYRILKAVSEIRPPKVAFGKDLAQKVFECKTDPENPSRYWQGISCKANSLANKLVSIGYLIRRDLKRHWGHNRGYYELTADGRRVLEAYLKKQEEQGG